MRTTVKIDDGLLAEAKTRAAQSGKTLAAVFEDALRAHFERRVAAVQPVDLPVFIGGRLLPGVDLDDNAELLDLVERNPA